MVDVGAALHPKLTRLDRLVLDLLATHNAARLSEVVAEVQRYQERHWFKRDRSTAQEVKEILRGLEICGHVTYANGWWRVP